MSAPTLTPTEPAPRTTLGRWAPVAVGVLAWWSLYHWNLPFWNWVMFDMVGLTAGSRLGGSIHFFFCWQP